MNLFQNEIDSAVTSYLDAYTWHEPSNKRSAEYRAHKLVAQLINAHLIGVQCESDICERVKDLDGFVRQLQAEFDCIYIDPSRRNDVKGKVFLLKDCLPNVPENIDFLFSKSNQILIKNSPILDITIAINELKFVKEIHIISLNNGYLGMVRQWQEFFYQKRYSMSYMDALPDFVKLAEAYGHVGITITKLEDLEPMLEKAFAMKDKLVFINVLVDPSEHVYPMQIARGSMKDMWLSKTERT